MARADITPDGNHAVLKLSRGEARRLKRQADALGIGVQEMVQRSFEQYARNRFPDAFSQEKRP